MTRQTLLAAAACGAIAAVSAAERTTVDFTARAGKIRRRLHSSGWGGQLTGAQSRLYMDLKPLNLCAARTHDWALNNAGQRMLDYYHVFPLLRADTQDPANYFFGPSDEILEMTVEDLGMEVMYRMGTSIESVNARRGAKDMPHPPRYYNSVEPSDWLQFAKVHAQIIRHYTEGWADGYRWGDKMRYWELWNEPNDMPGGSWIIKSGDKDKGTNDYTFNSFYIYVLKYLKEQFPHLKFGGPATCYFDKNFLRALLDRCAKEGYTPDFISWHSYGDDPRRMLSQPAEARKMLDEYGFKDTELVINEWHWFPDSWWGLFNKEGPEGYRKLLAKGTAGMEIKKVVTVDALHSGEEMAHSFVKRDGETLSFTKPDAESAAAYLVVFCACGADSR